MLEKRKDFEELKALALADATMSFLEFKEKSSHRKEILSLSAFLGVTLFPVTNCAGDIFANIESMIGTIGGKLVSVSIVLGALMIAVAAILYMLPATSARGTENALQLLKRAIIGCVVIGCLGGIINLIDTLISGNGYDKFKTAS